MSKTSHAILSDKVAAAYGIDDLAEIYDASADNHRKLVWITQDLGTMMELALENNISIELTEDKYVIAHIAGIGQAIEAFEDYDSKTEATCVAIATMLLSEIVI